MSYFKDFQTIQYDMTVHSDALPEINTITDLTMRVGLKLNEQSKDELTDKYLVQGGDTPEQVSYKLYGTPLYHWTILYINNIMDMVSEWPMSDQAIVTYSAKKYTDPNATHHYEKMPEMIVMDQDFIAEHYGQSAIREVTNIEYEEQLNEFKRYIVVIKPRYIKDFVTTFKSKMIA